MPYKFNPFTGTLDYYQSSSGGGISGPGSSTDKAIVRWNGTSGTVVQNSLGIVQDGGAIEAQAFLSIRTITGVVTVNNNESWIAPSIELTLTGSIVIESGGQVIIV